MRGAQLGGHARAHGLRPEHFEPNAAGVKGGGSREQAATGGARAIGW